MERSFGSDLANGRRPKLPIHLWDVAIDPVDATVAYYIRGYGGPPDNQVFRSMDRGASWQVINAPTTTNGGYSQALAVNPWDRSVLVAGQSMFYSSPDFGATWTTLNAPWDSRKILVLPGTSSLVMGSDQGLHWTDNVGRTWLDLTKPISANILFSVAVSGQTILTASQDFGPFLSMDGGSTWGAPTGPLAEGGGVAINPGDSRYCYAVTGSGFAVSSDHCLTFSVVAGPSAEGWVSAANQNRITIDPHNPSLIYVGAIDGVWSSTDWGITLRRLDWPMQQVTQIVPDPNDPQAIYVCASSGLYQSLNGGASWTQLAVPTNPYPYVAAVSPSDSNVILVAMSAGAGNYQGGILRSTDRGRTFNSANQGLSTARFNLGNDQQSIAFDPSATSGMTPVVALATTGGIYASADLGVTWHDIRSNAVPRIFSFVHWDQGYLWTATYGQGVLRSDRPLTSDSFVSNLAVTGGPIWFSNTLGMSAAAESQTLQVATVGGSQSFTATVTLGSNTSCGNWLSVSPTSGTTTGTATSTPVTVTYTVSGLPAYSNTTCIGAVAVTTGGANSSTVTIPVTLVVSPQPGYCTPVLNPTSALFGGSGGAGSVQFTLPAGCVWTVSGTPSWLSITSGSSGTGSGAVSHSVAAYTGTTRTAILTIGGATFTVIQTTGAAYLTTTIAGGALPSTAAPATSVTIPHVWGVAVDSAGNVYFDSPDQPVIFRIDTSGVLTRVAGTGSPGFSGDGGPGTRAQLSGNPQGIAVDSAGNLYIADC